MPSFLLHSAQQSIPNTPTIFLSCHNVDDEIDLEDEVEVYDKVDVDDEVDLEDEIE